MLPSTGYFKGNNCPFYDNGLCERPYCHFRHVKKDSSGSASTQSDGTESGEILQKLVSEAVQKVLQQTETSTAAPNTQDLRSDSEVGEVNSTQSKATYNPTPIAKLNKVSSAEAETIEEVVEQRKRHIPVPYTPRKPITSPVKRPIETNGSPKPFIYLPPPVKYTPGSAETVLDPYTPKGSVESTEKYLPGIDKEVPEYTVKETNTLSKHNYVPSDKVTNKNSLLEYKPSNTSSNSELPGVTYLPTPKSSVPCFLNDEDEPNAKKRRLWDDILRSDDTLDDLAPEFELLDQILNEEKSPLFEDLADNEIENLEAENKSDSSESAKKHNNEGKVHIKSSHKHKKSSHSSVDKKPGKHHTKTFSKHEDKKSSSKTEDKKSSSKNEHKKCSSNQEDKKSSSKLEDKKLSSKHEDKKLSSNNDKKTQETTKLDKKTQENLKLDKKTQENLKSDKKTQENLKSDKKTQENPKLDKKTQEDLKLAKKFQENMKSDKKEKSSIHSRSDAKFEECYRKSHKSSSKDQVKDEKGKESDSKKPDKTSRSSKHSNNSKHSHTSKSSDTHAKDHKSSRSNHNSKTREDKHNNSNHNSKHGKEHKSIIHKNTKKSREKHRKEKESVHANDTDMFDNDNNIDEVDSYQELSFDISESDEESIALECKRIFEEYVPSQKPLESTNPNSHKHINNENEIILIPGKKRISHTVDKNIKVTPKAPLKPDYKVSAAQAMAERLAKVKEYHATKNVAVTTTNNATLVLKSEPIKTSVNFTNPMPTKIRIAHVPYASTMMNAKRGITTITKTKPEEPSTSTTIVQTVKKGIQRVAHIPNEKFVDRPGVLEPLGSKIPANIRSTYLNMMIDECLKIYLSATDAYARAQHEELTTSKKCSTVQIYKNSAVLTVSRLRKELQECKGIKKAGADCSALQKIPHLNAGHSNSLGSWSIESKRLSVQLGEFSGVKFYNNIKKWVLTEEQLQENGFPRPHTSGEKGRAIIYGQKKNIPPKGLIRTCCRCKKEYIVDKKGFPAIKEECIYHPNNKYRVRGEVKYQCCSQDSTSDGCCIAPSHVYDNVDFENLKGYVKTMPPEHKMDDYGVYSLDCEMCYTTQGLDLTRVTVINSECKVLYETLIKPLHPIIDYNTRYSGITEEQMANVKTTLLEVQATLLSMFNSESILIGHSLESDFKALKLIHDTVIDTSVLFPHKMGPPYKRALRHLSSEYLKKIIQNSVDGHDSAEDATVCMELLIYKLKEDLKTR